ncbi:MAG: PAS domain-containing protein [Steroidobacteraceae bacterium]
MHPAPRPTVTGDLAPDLFRDMAEQWPGAVVMVNRDGVIRWANDMALDWAPAGADLVGRPLGDLSLPWLREENDLSAVLGGGARQFPPRAVIDRRGRERHCGARFVPLRRGQLVCGALLYIEESPGTDGSTVVQAAAISDTSRAAALSAAQVGAWHLDLHSGEGGVDAGWCAALRLDACAGADHLTRWEKRVHPDNAAEFHGAREELEQGVTTSFEVEFRVLTDDSRWIWLLQRGQVIEFDDKGRPLRAAGICIEIDARKRAEVALQEKESRLATALWGARAAFWHWNITSDVQTRSAMWFAMTGYQREEWERDARPWHTRLHPEDTERVERTIRDHFEGRSQSLEIEYRIRVATGEYRWFQDRGRVNEWDFQGNPTVAIGVSLDIEAQKQAELDLRSSEARLETALWGAKIGLWELDFATEQTRWHNDWCERLDVESCEGSDHVKRWDENIHPDDVGEAQRNFSAHVAGRSDHYDAEYRLRTRGGEWRWLFERGRVVDRAPDGAPLRMVGVCMDIEDRAVAEHDAREMQQRLEHAIGVARIGIWSWDLADDRFHCNDLYAQYVFGGERPQGPLERRDRRFACLHPDELAAARVIDEEIRAGKRDEFEVQGRLRNAQGEWRWVLQRGRVTARTADGAPARMAGFLVDVSRMQEQIDARERAVATLHAVTGHAPDHLLLLDSDLVVQFANRAWPPHMSTGLVGGRIADFLPPTCRDLLVAHFNRVLDSGRSEEIEVADHCHGSASPRYLVSRASPVTERGAIMGLSVAITDNTARHVAEERSRATESVLRTIADVTSDWLVMLDSDLRFVFINHGFGGHAPAEIVGRTLREFAPRQRSGNLLALAEEVLQSGEPRVEEQEFIAPEGVQRCLELRVRPVHSVAACGAGGPGIVINATDITARKALERELLEIAHREQQRMGSDLHDGLSQDLTGIALMLRGVAGQLRKERSEARADVEEVIGLVNSAIESTRVLASGLSPVNIERGGLVAALESLAARMRDRHGVDVTVVTRFDAHPALADAALNHLYRIAQEAVINAIRHGNPKHVGIELGHAAGQVHLHVADDGRGFGAHAGAPTGLGLKIMRYRAQMLGGSLRVGSAGAKGVRVECVCPLAANQRASAS